MIPNAVPRGRLALVAAITVVAASIAAACGAGTPGAEGGLPDGGLPDAASPEAGGGLDSSVGPHDAAGAADAHTGLDGSLPPEASTDAAGADTAPPPPSGPLPCDIYGAAGTPCVGAFSTVRALYDAYAGPLYQVARTSDHTTRDIAPLVAGSYADAASQDAFCAGTTCAISIVYDQSPQHNDLTIAGAGTAGSADRGAPADALPITAGGRRVYGIYVTPGVGYRHPVGKGVATNGQPEGMYMVGSGTNVNGDCCADFGNVEAAEDDTGASHMDALTLSLVCDTPPCAGVGPWVEADLENGLYPGHASNAANLGNASVFVTAVLKNDGQTNFALKGGNAQSGALGTWYSGALPAGYSPMHQEGSIVLGTGGDNSNRSMGSFFEGVMTAGFPPDSADDAVQANVVAVGYAGTTGAGQGAVIKVPSGKCVDVAGEDTGVNGAFVQLSDCEATSADQHWTRNSDNTLRALGRCLDIDGNGTAPGTKVELWDCNGVGGQSWVAQPNGSVLNPQSGLCLDDPAGDASNGTQLQIAPCDGRAEQQFTVGGSPVVGPGGKCVGVGTPDAGEGQGGNGALVELFTCQPNAVDQHWVHYPDGTLRALGRCLDIDGNGTAPGTKVELWDCDGVGGQIWLTQPNGSVLNPQSGVCLDDPSGNTADGTQLQIWTCNDLPPQQFALP